MSEARMEVLQGRKKHSSTFLITSGLNMLLCICRSEVERSAGITTWWIFHVRGKDGSFARSEEAQFDLSYHFWSKHALVHMQIKTFVRFLMAHTTHWNTHVHIWRRHRTHTRR